MAAVEDEIGGRILRIEEGKFITQAQGSVVVRYGDTLLLATVCVSPEPREGVDFLPLVVDYEERLYAVGKIPGGYFRREGRPSQDEILTSRLTDRPIRPLIPKNFRNDIQIIVTVLSADQENPPDILSIIGASSALLLSPVPFEEPVGAVRVGYINGDFVVNPTFKELSESILDIIVAGTKEKVMMIEGGGKEVPEDIFFEAVKFGHEWVKRVVELEEGLGRRISAWEEAKPSEEAVEEACRFIDEKVGEISWSSREERDRLLSSLREGFLEINPEGSSIIEEAIRRKIRRRIIDEGVRPDGRREDEIREVECEVGILPRTHGSALFRRGETQILTIATLGSPGEEQLLDTLGPEETKRFIHHYNFPPFSTGEVRRIGLPSRREIGHGALAERALLPVIPPKEDFPYTIRLVSEVLSSNGSTSMGSVCGSTLSLMDAGVPIKEPVAGISIGLVKEERWVLLTDIEGMEDACGDMDFKIAGTKNGITAVQLDLKIKGLDFEIMEKALERGREARLYLLEKMREAIPSVRPSISKYAPKIRSIKIDPDKIRFVIGPGGRMIRSITSETGVSIDINSDGTIILGSQDEEAIKRAMKIIEDLTREVEVGEIYTGKVTRLLDFGAMVEILPGKEGLVRNQDLTDRRISHPSEVVKVGDEIVVMVTGIDNLGRINLSRKAVIQKFSQMPGMKVRRNWKR